MEEINLWAGGMQTLNRESAVKMFLTDGNTQQLQILYALDIPIIWIWVGNEFPSALNPEFFNIHYKYTQEEWKRFLENE